MHGGNSSNKSDKNERFFQEIINGVESDTIKILCVYFARPEHRWEDSYAEDQSIFRALETNKEIETILATYDRDELEDNIAQSDVIFINGGMQGHLKNTLQSIGIERFRRMVAGKTLVGISAGANILARYYYATAAKEIREGTGFLSIKLFTHYSEDESEKLEQLRVHAEDLPIVTIAEEEYLVIE